MQPRGKWYHTYSHMVSQAGPLASAPRSAQSAQSSQSPSSSLVAGASALSAAKPSLAMARRLVAEREAAPTPRSATTDPTKLGEVLSFISIISASYLHDSSSCISLNIVFLPLDRTWDLSAENN